MAEKNIDTSKLDQDKSSNVKIANDREGRRNRRKMLENRGGREL
jgi:hypothetical protein